MVLDLKRVLGKLKVNGLFFYGSCVLLLIIVVVVVVDDDDIVIDDDVLLKSIIKVMVPEVVDFLLLCGFLLRLCMLCFSFLEEPN